MLLYIAVFLVRETVIVRPFQRNQDCYCDYFTLILFNQVRFRFRLRLGCPGSLVSLYGPTFHVTPVYLCIIFQCSLYISCIMSCGNKIVSVCFVCQECTRLVQCRVLCMPRMYSPCPEQGALYAKNVLALSRVVCFVCQECTRRQIKNA